ncbi:MAG TPA: NADH-quinone oxidoreductase subunit NuoF [Syntrophomonadaceae bacterium]|nr:NADH-quinone oxidoreductase subunit NuoF [Syntrophomonadaceae bacterium]HNX28910.1 NADH-quinone oxidoreductase subunit NuoF [Syntrophomonadaceae bacterium]HPR94241.1 NADH-quinone oxidoreductase subunit NuoF [Syntrophomonadaceae bacterium]
MEAKVYKDDRQTVLVCCGTGCTANGGREVFRAFQKRLENHPEMEVLPVIKATGCNGWCEKGPLVRLMPRDITYCSVAEKDVDEIVDKTLLEGVLIKRLLYRDPVSKDHLASHHLTDFYRKQHKIALRNIGEIDPGQINDYIEREGYQALKKALQDMDGQAVIDAVKTAGLRGRGGGGFPTGSKWQSCRDAKGEPKYIICNGDEGDPGAFMDRSIMEGDPHTVIEGMILGAYAVGATHGYIYVRDEYDLAVQYLGQAVKDARQQGYLGSNIMGSELSFDIELVRGGGAFVCGEETALMASIEGRTGEPRDKYVYPTEKGLWGKPTIINNVETWANVPVIILHGAEAFAAIGTEKSKGTKVFSLVGKVVNTGLVEVPMGTTLREIIYEIGGGVLKKRRFKAVQTGGPSGGCIPASLLDLPIDFDSLTEAGSMMGSGGLIVMDDHTCMVEVARYYVNFLAGESCGKCTPCREGIRAMLEILTDICNGKGKLEDLQLLEDISATMQEASLCALGRTAPNPVLSTLRYFRDEYIEHIENRFCPAGICRELTTFYIDPEKCTGCTLCMKSCAVNAITGEKKQVHVIDESSCIRCGECYRTCNFDAIKLARRDRHEN